MTTDILVVLSFGVGRIFPLFERTTSQVTYLDICELYSILKIISIMTCLWKIPLLYENARSYLFFLVLSRESESLRDKTSRIQKNLLISI